MHNPDAVVERLIDWLVVVRLTRHLVRQIERSRMLSEVEIAGLVSYRSSRMADRRRPAYRWRNPEIVSRAAVGGTRSRRPPLRRLGSWR